MKAVFHGSALIRVLLGSGRPLAVAWLIVAVVVYPLYGHSGGSLPHVSQEVEKGRSPSFADLDSSTAIVRVCPASWVGGPLEHPIPDGIFRCPSSAGRGSVFDRPGPVSLCVEAAAARFFSMYQSVFSRRNCLSAVAKACPELPVFLPEHRLWRESSVFGIHMPWWFLILPQATSICGITSGNL